MARVWQRIRRPLRVADIHALRVYVNVPQSYSAEIVRGMTVSLTVSEYPGKTFAARLVSTSNAISAQSSTLLVEFEADGRAVVCLIQSLAKRGGWPLGHDIDVLYDPSNPHRARAANAGLNVSGWLLLGVAVIGTFLAIVT